MDTFIRYCFVHNDKQTLKSECVLCKENTDEIMSIKCKHNNNIKFCDDCNKHYCIHNRKARFCDLCMMRKYVPNKKAGSWKIRRNESQPNVKPPCNKRKDI